MEALLDAICNFAADDSKWEEGHLKTATEKVAQGESGFQLDPRTMAMALLGAGGLAGGGALSGRLSGKQLAMLALLGAAVGGGGHELYKYLSPGSGGSEGGETEGGGGSIFTPSLAGATGGAAVGAGLGGGIGASTQLFQELGDRGRSSLRAVLTAPTPEVAADRLAVFLQRDADLQKRLGIGDPGGVEPGEIESAARNLWQFSQARGINPNDPRSVRNVEEMLRSGTMDFDWEGDVPEQQMSDIRRRASLFDRLTDRARVGGLQQDPANPQRFSVPEDTDAYERLRAEIDEFENLNNRYRGIDDSIDLDNLKARGRMNLLTGEVPDLQIGGASVGKTKLPTSFKAINAVRNRLNRGIGFQARRFAPRMRGILGGLGAGAGGGALLGGLFGND